MGKLSDKQVKFVAESCGNPNLKYVSYNIDQVTDIEYKIQHNRLAHVNNEYLIKMCDDNLADGIQETCVRKNFTCDICNLGKIERRPRKEITKILNRTSLELVYCDVCGLMPVTSVLNGSRYILVIVDDYSGMYFTQFLNHKNETLKNFILFKEKYE